MDPSNLRRLAQVTTTKQYLSNALTSMCNLPTLLMISNIFLVQRDGRVAGYSIMWIIILSLMIALMRGRLLIVLMLVALTAAEEGGVKIVNASSLREALDGDQKVLLYFSQEDCKHCEQFSEIYTLVSKLHSELAVFYKLTLSQETAKTFQSYGIDSTPTVLAFDNGEGLPFRYQPIGSGNGVSVQFFKWVQRLFQTVQQWDSDDSHSHQLIVQCHNQQFSEFWQEVSRSELWLDVYCGNEELLKGNLAIVHEYGRQVEAWQMENDFEQVSPKLRRLIRAYKYKYVLPWDTAIAQEVFTNNVSAFVLIVNNETRSRQIQEYYEQIKKQWYENSHSYEPTIFVMADLSVNPSEALQLKRYLTAHTSFIIKDYYYPIIGFISRGTHEAKYLVDLTSPKNKTTLEDFIEDVNEHIIKGTPYEGEASLVPWLNEVNDMKEKQVDDEEEKKELVRKILTQENWNDMLVKYDNPFFVYFTWRHSNKICKLESEFVEWWKGEDPDFTPHRHAYDIFLHMYHAVDLPEFPGLTVDYFPSLFYFSKEKKIRKLEGVTDLQKIKKFIKEVYQKESHH